MKKFVAVVILVAGAAVSMSSCTSHGEVCPAYSKADINKVVKS